LIHTAIASNNNIHPDSIASATGLIPADVPDMTTISPPVLSSILNNEISFPVRLTAKANKFAGSSTIEFGEFPAANGDPTTGVNLREWLLTRKAAMEFEVGKVT